MRAPVAALSGLRRGSSKLFGNALTSNCKLLPHNSAACGKESTIERLEVKNSELWLQIVPARRVGSWDYPTLPRESRSARSARSSSDWF